MGRSAFYETKLIFSQNIIRAVLLGSPSPRTFAKPKSRSGTLGRVKEALEAASIVFIGDPIASPGVQLVAKPQLKKSQKRGAARNSD